MKRSRGWEIFREETGQWFLQEMGQPTRVQEEAWPLIAAGRHTLVSAPTGTGKTLAAFLVFLDRLMGLAAKIRYLVGIVAQVGNRTNGRHDSHLLIGIV